MKNIKFTKTACLAMILAFSLAGCGNKESSTDNSSSLTQTQSSSQQPSSSVITSASVIKNLTAKEESVNIKIGDSILLTSYYTIEGNTGLSTAQKQCTYTSSDESIVKINNKKAEAVAPGEAIITITSKVDTTKTCQFTIKVDNVFIDRESTHVPSEDDFSKEWSDELGTGEFTTNSMISNFYYVRGINSKNWYLESDITIQEVASGEEWPKIGFFARSFNSSEKETMIAFYINAEIGKENNSIWNKFGFCEAAPGSRWAWEAGITDSFARHQDAAYTSPTDITRGTTFKFGVAREDSAFHIYVNGTYAYSHKLSTSLDVLCENGKTLDSNAGFYQYNSKVTFSNYKYDLDITNYKPTTPNYITEFNVDENEG